MSTIGLSVLLAAVLPLFENGATRWKVSVAPDAAPCVKFAAEEFAAAMGKVSGATFEVTSEAGGSSPTVIIGGGADEWADEVVEYRLEKGNLLLTGNQPRAVLHAVYAFLQREMGVRWLWPGEDGEVFPRRERWTFPKGFGYRHTPSIKYRGFHHCGVWRNRDAFNLWQTRNYGVITRHGARKGEERLGHYSMVSSHNAHFGNDEAFFREHPECYALLDGKRSKLNICFSSELAAVKAVERMRGDIGQRIYSRVDIFSMLPLDSMDYCQCERCREKGVSNAWFTFYNRVVAELKKTHPHLRFATVAYQGFRDAPTCPIKEAEFVEYALHSRSHVHLLGDPRNEENAREVGKLEKWFARKDVKVGLYTYENDSVLAHHTFQPIFSLVNETVDYAVAHGVVTILPEITLGPAKVPEERVWAVQNRTMELFYAWKMWDASLTVDGFLDDLTRNAYGPAAPQLKEYFKLLDAAWGKMKGRVVMFADGMNVAEELLSDERVRRRTADLLAQAEKIVREKGDARELRNVLREKALYAQIADNRNARLGLSTVFAVPHLDKDRKMSGGSAGLTLENTAGKPGAVSVVGCWTDGELALKWRNAEDASVDLTVDGSRYTFSFLGGKPSAKMVSDVGVESATYAPEWRAGRTAGGVTFRIPFAALARPPASGEAWDARYAAGAEAMPRQADMTIKTRFIPAAVAGRPLVYCLGTGSNIRSRRPNLQRIVDDGTLTGWKVTVCTNGAELAAAAASADTYYLDVPEADCVSKETAETMRERVKAGGTLLVASWLDVPLAKFLGDETLKCHCTTSKPLTIGDRHAKFVREGDWTHAPWAIEKDVRRSYAPCYMQIFDPSMGAVEYAGMPSKEDDSKMLPFISGMRYGKGAIILIGADFYVSYFKILDNIRKDLGCP